MRRLDTSISQCGHIVKWCATSASNTVVHILITEPDVYTPAAAREMGRVGMVIRRRMLQHELSNSIHNFTAVLIGLETRIDSHVLKAGHLLRVVGTATTGLDHIDVAFAEKCGIQIVSLKGDTSFLQEVHATAEHTFALVLAMLRKIPWAFHGVLTQRWERKEFQGVELHNKTLGIIGFGRLGRKVAGYGQAFGMRILAHDPHVHDSAIKSNGVVATSLEIVLKESDVISIHVPLMSDTENLLTASHFALMRPTAFLVNTSRGRVVDEAALLKTLQDKRIAGAAVDVLAAENTKENPLTDNPMVEYARTHDNLLITPHIGGATHESLAKTGEHIARKVREVLMQQVPQHGTN